MDEKLKPCAHELGFTFDNVDGEKVLFCPQCHASVAIPRGLCIRNDVLEEAAIKEAIKDGLDGWIGITDIPEATDSIIAAIRARKDQTDG